MVVANYEQMRKLGEKGPSQNTTSYRAHTDTSRNSNRRENRSELKSLPAYS